tara:strand:+ start:669 stop:1253 length:585 start_codon:yes stop_codon:yes gene_type:complete
MVKSIGLRKVNTAVFISGTGSNLKNLIKFSLIRKSPININFVISDKNKAKGLNYARKFNLKKKIYNFKNRDLDEKKILVDLKKYKIKLVCLAGFMKILSKDFIKKFNGKIINIHPSLLPKYKGLKTHERALKNKEKFSGCTVHYVSSKLDSGKIILQKKVKISKNDTVNTLAKKILKKEHKLFPEAIKKVISNL